MIARLRDLLPWNRRRARAAAIAKSKAHHPAYRLLYKPPIV